MTEAEKRRDELAAAHQREAETRAPQWRMDPVYVRSESRARDVGNAVYAADADGMPLSKLDPTAVIQPGSTVWVRRG